MKWSEGIDKLGLSLYFILCIFAIVNINSVDPVLGKKQLVFFLFKVLNKQQISVSVYWY